MALSKITSNAFSKTANTNIDNGTLFVDPVNNRVGMGTISPVPSYALTVANEQTTGTAVDNCGVYIKSVNRSAFINFDTVAQDSRPSSLVYSTAGVEKGRLAYDHTSNGLYITTNNVERLRISSSGYVTMPYQPMFSAYSSNGTGITTSGTQRKMPYTNQAVDSGTFYDESISRFTAPVAGKYLFAYNALLLGGGSGNLTLFKNGATAAGSNGHARAINGTNESCISQTVIISLAANDYVEVYYWNDGGSNSFYGAHGSFCGTLIG